MVKMLWFLLALLGDGESPSRTAAEAALKQASALRRESYGTKGDEKLAILTRAAENYEGVARAHAAEHDVAAEAWFRAGEIHRTLRRVEEAERCFRLATAETGVPSFAARAWNEIGHLHRRTKDWAGALAAYAEVERRFADEREQCMRALEWRGKTLILQKDVPAGLEVLLSVGKQYPEFPVEAVRCIDTVAVAWLKEGRRAEAEALVRQCLADYEPHSTGEDREARDLAKALQKMHAREGLQGGALPEELVADGDEGP